jgi:hypothetical protein
MPQARVGGHSINILVLCRIVSLDPVAPPASRSGLSLSHDAEVHTFSRSCRLSKKSICRRADLRCQIVEHGIACIRDDNFRIRTDRSAVKDAYRI